MIRTVKVKTNEYPPIRHIFIDPDPGRPLEEQIPDFKATRIFMGIVPPEGRSPGYACVIAELYDNDPAQHTRERVMLDEGIALDPDDFSPEERLQFGVHPKSIEHPTIESLRRAIVALKDLWLPDLVIIPPPDDGTFARIVKTTEGLTSYDRRMEAHFQYWFPFYRCDVPVKRKGVTVAHTEPLAGVATPEVEDPEMNAQIVANLQALDLLTIVDDEAPADGMPYGPRRPCRHFHERREQWSTIHRAMGLVLHWMQDQDLTYQMRQWENREVGYMPLDEFARKAQVQEEEALGGQLDLAQAMADQAAWMAGRLDLDADDD